MSLYYLKKLLYYIFYIILYFHKLNEDIVPKTHLKIIDFIIIFIFSIKLNDYFTKNI